MKLESKIGGLSLITEKFDSMKLLLETINSKPNIGRYKLNNIINFSQPGEIKTFSGVGKVRFIIYFRNISIEKILLFFDVDGLGMNSFDIYAKEGIQIFEFEYDNNFKIFFYGSYGYEVSDLSISIYQYQFVTS